MEPPLRLTVYAWEAQPGRLSMTASCELTAKLVHGAEAELTEASPFYDDLLRQVAEADVRAPFKPRCDVLVAGNAYTPAAEPEVDRLLVRVRVGEWSKAVRVTGDRFWLRDPGGRLVPGPPRKFRRMLLTQERAPRTPETPVGIDLEAVPIEHRIALPNLEPASVGYSAILGPVAQNAPSRSSLIHPMAAGWVHAMLAGQRAGPPPEGFNFAYFNLAPADQQLPEIPIGPAVVLENLHPEHAIFTSRLPSVRPRAFVFDPQKLRQVEIPLRCDTLWIDADRGLATMVWRGVLPISHPDLATQVVTKVEQVEREVRPPEPDMLETRLGATVQTTALPFGQGLQPPLQQPLHIAIRAPGSAPPAAPRPVPRRTPLPGQMFVTQEIHVGAGLGALPFEGLQPPEEETTQNLGDDPTTASSGRLPPPPPRSSVGRATHEATSPASSPEPSPPSGAYAPIAPGMERVVVRLKPPDIGPTRPPPLPPKPPARNGSTHHDAETGTSSGPPDSAPLGDLRLGKSPILAHSTDADDDEPLTRQRSAEPTPVSERKLALRPPSSSKPLLGVMQPAPAATPPPSTVSAAPTETASSPPPASVAIPTPARPMDAPPDDASPTDASPTRPLQPGTGAGRARPLSGQRNVFEESTDSYATLTPRGVEARTLEEAEADADRDAFEFPLPPSDGFEVDGVTLDHCAAIRAAFGMPGSNRTSVLAKHELDEASFARIEKAHLARVDQENTKGVHDLLNRYDAAYVAEQDRLRRPIGVKEYARIVVARKRGELADVMNELGVPRSELMRLDRVWKRRAVEYPEVGEALRQATEAMGDT